MARYEIKFSVTGNNPKTIVNLIKKVFPEVSVGIEKYEEKSRANRYADAQQMFEDSKSEVSSLKEELESWRDGLPENLQNGSKADELDEAIQGLESVESEMESVNFDDVSFPGMF